MLQFPQQVKQLHPLQDSARIQETRQLEVPGGSSSIGPKSSNFCRCSEAQPFTFWKQTSPPTSPPPAPQAFLLTPAVLLSLFIKWRHSFSIFFFCTDSKQEKKNRSWVKSWLFYINYKMSLDTAWDHFPALIKMSLLCKHSSANLEALNKKSSETPQGWTWLKAVLGALVRSS